MNALGRPSMPIGELSYADWLAKYRQQLIEWFMHCYQRTEVDDEEWVYYCRGQFLKEQETVA